MYYVYVLQSLTKRDFVYVGYTEDVFSRFDKHNNREVQSTKPYVPYDLIFYEAYKHKADARRREIYLKTTSGRRTLKLMLKNSLMP
jgi:putative endonuclease